LSAQASDSRVTRLVGFDTAGEPFLSEGRVIRGIYKGNAALVRRVLDICEKNHLFSRGVVATRELKDNPHPELDNEMLLEHERIPFVTFPHEWSASMFKEAALFHIELFQELEKHGLTLKDWHPQNILFSGTRPVFVDFTSIIPVEELTKQEYLKSGRPPSTFADRWDPTSKAIYEMYRLMFEPYFGLPLAMMDRGHHAKARQRMYETTLNAADTVITRSEVFGDSLYRRLRYEGEQLLLQTSLLEKGPKKPAFFRRLHSIVKSRQAALKGSAYSSYYEDKNEVFSSEPEASWTNKQHGVHGALTQFKPRTVLDLGSNTGWFSMLAAKLGSSVVAVDLDEASIDRLFKDAKNQQLDVLPLVANLVRPLPALAANVYENEPSLSLIGDALPLISQPDTRLQCEMVMALAIVHHLALGQSHSFEDIAAILARLGTKYLCVEFVDIDDEMITSDPGFFPAYNSNRSAFGWYSRENFMDALRAHYTTIEVVPSHPASRTLLIGRRTT
jgi:SAM-dependent methyltransferase